jgi:hypothetical protein
MQQMMEMLLKEIKAGQEKMVTKLSAHRITDKEEIRTNQDKLLATMEADREERRVGQGKLREKIETEKEEMKAQCDRCGQSWMRQSNIELKTFFRSLNTTNGFSSRNWKGPSASERQNSRKT